MGVRGRKSAADLATSPVALVPQERPKAPECLDKEAAEAWEKLVGAMPADWFGPESYPILESYCWHVSAARHISRMIEEHKQLPEKPRRAIKGEKYFDVRIYARLLRLRAEQSSVILTLARSMRLTHQSTIDPKTAGRKKRNERGDGVLFPVAPWVER
jgi:phage terminase small subunit